MDSFNDNVLSNPSVWHAITNLVGCMGYVNHYYYLLYDCIYVQDYIENFFLNFFQGEFKHDPKLGTCSITIDRWGRSSKTALFITGFIIPCIVIVCCYTGIFWVIRK